LENEINNSTFDGIMDELHQKYNVRPRNKILTIAQTKKILPRGKTN
jgi:hypothetical protein